jgi:putative glutathione S-transferase
LKQVYKSVNPDYSARVTVPVLFDKKRMTIVNNESGEILRLFNSFLNSNEQDQDQDQDGPLKAKAVDLYPPELAQEIDSMNEWIYDLINNGVYKAGFATTQKEYSAHAPGVFEGFARANRILSGVNDRDQQHEPREYLCGPGRGQLTEADLK